MRTFSTNPSKQSPPPKNHPPDLRYALGKHCSCRRRPSSLPPVFLQVAPTVPAEETHAENPATATAAGRAVEGIVCGKTSVFFSRCIFSSRGNPLFQNDLHFQERSSSVGLPPAAAGNRLGIQDDFCSGRSPFSRATQPAPIPPMLYVHFELAVGEK